jgi:hypothetical protein
VPAHQVTPPAATTCRRSFRRVAGAVSRRVCRRAPARQAAGQATVETVALLPIVALVGALLWQGAVAGQAMWLAGTAARRAARAEAVGADPRAAAIAVLPERLERGLVVRVERDGVRVRIRVPAVAGGGRLATVSARAHLQAQTP